MKQINLQMLLGVIVRGCDETGGMAHLRGLSIKKAPAKARAKAYMDSFYPIQTVLFRADNLRALRQNLNAAAAPRIGRGPGTC